MNIEQSIRIQNPLSRLEDGRIVSSGDPEYEALISEWVNAALEKEAEELQKFREGLILNRAQFGEMLIRRGIMQQVIDLIEAIPDGTERLIMREWFEKTPTVRRLGPKVETFRIMLGITPETADEWFEVAMSYE